jgi:hypothetical protein
MKYYFESLNILSNSQHSFREKRSFESALNKIMDYWRTLLDIGESVIAVFILAKN